MACYRQTGICFCGIDSKKLYAPLSTDDRYKISCKDSCSWQQDEGCPAKQYVIGFIREGSLGQWSETVWPEEDGLLKSRLGAT
ncbi:hypothetical protein TNCV_89391 [Trichonephila clavipes]|nr:hypothetical protein TNCV_89391 [Trichonephila clavipes]